MGALIDMITVVINFLWSQLQSILSLISLIPGMLQAVYGTVNYLPSFLFGVFTLSLQLTLLFGIWRLIF